MQRDSIKAAVVGLGKMGQYHLRALESLQRGEFEGYYKADSREILSRLEICGVCDIAKAKKSVAGAYPFYTEPQDLLRTAGPDLVILAAPTGTHFELARQCLEARAHVFVEKPIVTRSEEFAELLKTAHVAGRKMIAGHVERYNPVALKVRQWLTEQRPSGVTFRFERIQPHDSRIKDDIITDKLVHDLDLSMFLFGPIQNVSVLDCRKADGQVHEVLLETEHHGGRGRIFLSWLRGEQTRRRLELTAADRHLEGDFLNKTLRIEGEPVVCRVPRWIEAKNNQVKDELVDFLVHCFSQSRDAPNPLLTIDEIAASVHWLETISKNLYHNAQ